MPPDLLAALPFQPLELATYWLIALNFAAFAAFGIDKARAEAGAWRISESTLLTLALLGGTPGAYAGRYAFRHKTRKAPFVRALGGVAMFQVAGALVAAFLAATGTLPGAVPAAASAAWADGPVPLPSSGPAGGAARGPMASIEAPDDRSGPIDDTPSGLGLSSGAWQSRHAAAPVRSFAQAAPVGGRAVGCSALRAAGRAPVYAGDPDYHPDMDGDGDGIACEPLRR
ncbi:DUF1294 domain-containing protein [Erythrobacteraceae bacterium CFH 75059]|uniref:DUF1294 domain-containing protein n=1 Tax=Qipengyuania thermophila TaxID=2509361 RepID=UPI00101FA1C1|nr:DUF1294 domain-containing protein [Qipengyuania thermophila]TCD06934.1 DUF1294 domain-containing protein [Erythrobacteraceae bacterium CFH 75059]